LLGPGDRVLVGVSGGADSVALLDLLRTLAPRLGLALGAFHLNHGLREQAGRDEEFVRGLCRKWKVKLVAERVDAAGFARRQRRGIEEAAREVRHRRLEQAADRLGCNRIALGHTANDNLETMLLNLVRGTGPGGLAGIPVKRGRVVRPLIDIEREALERHLRARGIEWVEDETNIDVRFRRNLVRHRVVPLLLELNQAAVANARRTARLLADESDYLDAQACDAGRSLARQEDLLTQIDIAGLGAYNHCLKRRIIKQLVPELDAEAVERTIDFAASGKTGQLSLTAGVRCRLRKGVLEFVPTQEKATDGR
jgi:tRNA(Ile)-lysidine synthase